jgi:hypothetical protein
VQALHGHTTPVQGWVVRTGESEETPPISPAFDLDDVVLDVSQESPHVFVQFRWDGEEPLFAVPYRVETGDGFNWGEPRPEGFALSIKVALDEDLLGVGFSRAVRELRDGIVWLRWDRLTD